MIDPSAPLPPEFPAWDATGSKLSAASATPPLYRFDDFTLDCARGELRRAGELVVAGQQTLQLLELLIRRPGYLVDRATIHAHVWPGVSVSEGSMRQAVWELRQALDDSASTPRYVQTVRGRGYRFLAPVTCADTPPGQPAAVPATRSRVVGRDAQRARLRAALEGAIQGSGRAALLRGPAGIGKSLLACTLMQEAERQEITCLEATALRDAGLPPFSPWIRLVDGLLRALPAERRARYLADAPLVARLLATDGDVGAAPHTVFADGPVLERIYLFESLARLFTSEANGLPLLLLLEDAQWLDGASLAFLQYLAGILGRTRTLLLLTCRDVPRRENRPLARALDTVARSPMCEVIELAHLTPDEVTQLLVCEDPRFGAPELVERVHTITAGNPLYALEVARLLSARAHSPGAAQAHEADLELRRVLRARLTGLPAASRRVLQALSVWGEEGNVAELATVLELEGEHVLTLLEHCISEGFVVAKPDGMRFGFAHPLMAEVAYESLSAVERGQLHLRAGCWLERRCDERGSLSALAHHFTCAAAIGGAERAIRYATASAERAFAATAFDEAVRQYDRALAACDLVPGFEASRRLALEIARLEAAQAAAPRDRALSAGFMALSERAEALGDASSFARAALGFEEPFTCSAMLTNYLLIQSSARIALLERARAMLPETALELRSRVASALSFALPYTPASVRRAQLSEEAVLLATQHGSAPLLAHALRFALWARSAPSEYEAQRRVADRLAILARSHQLRELELGACSQRLVLALYRGDLPSAERDGARAGALATELGSERALVASQLLPLIKAFWEGDIAQAEALTEASFRVQTYDLQNESVYLTRRSALELLRIGAAYLPQVITRGEGGLALAPDATSIRCGLASSLAAYGRLDEACAMFDEVAQDDFETIPAASSWLGDMIALADCAVRLGDAHRAARVCAQLLPYRDRMAFFYCDALPAGPVARGLAELYAVMGDSAAAMDALQRSRALNRALGARLFLIYDQLTEARVVSLLRPPNWRGRAAQALDEVVRHAEPLGARWLIDSAREVHRANLRLESRSSG